jgi:hypothetical protein
MPFIFYANNNFFIGVNRRDFSVFLCIKSHRKSNQSKPAGVDHKQKEQAPLSPAHIVCFSLYSPFIYSFKTKTTTAMAMTVEIKNGKLCIEIDLETPTPSSSGKTLVVASTHGNSVTSVMIEGKPVTIGLNAYIKK